MRPLQKHPLYYWLDERASHRIDAVIKRISRDKEIDAKVAKSVCERMAVGY